MNIPTFGEFLTEKTTPGKNTHLTHLEDVILDDGPAGAPFALKVLREFGKVLDGGKVSRALNVSVKWDGAPALVFGPDPADGRFFVATKGAFAKNPKLAKSHADIDTLYQSGVKNVLHAAFNELQALQPSVVLQGDVLFTPDALGQQTIDGTSYLTFQPNTILYAVPNDSTLGQQIASAAFGIVIHTMYTGRGNSLAGYSSSAVTPAVFSSLKRTRRVLALDAAYDDVSGTVTFTDQERTDFLLAYEAAKASKVDGRVYEFILGEPFHGLLQQFINQQVRAGRSLGPSDAVNELILFLSRVKDKEVSARKTPAAQQQQIDKYDRIIGDVQSNRRQLIQWFILHGAIQRAKDIIVRKLGQASRVASFVRTENGLKVTGPEGFVAVAHNGKAVKLVDRLEFSRLNFLAPKAWS